MAGHLYRYGMYVYKKGGRVIYYEALQTVHRKDDFMNEIERSMSEANTATGNQVY